ncbi:unnamed protein product [Symbiodinium sp. CCMP2456]|nr:unnamed protein product [Symbiodinium sp. CCMP2456]
MHLGSGLPQRGTALRRLLTGLCGVLLVTAGKPTVMAVVGARAAAAKPLKRPDLKPGLDVDVFKACYWEVKELAAFCREHGLSTSGVKADVTQRVETYLRTGKRATEPDVKSSSHLTGARDSALPGGLKLTTPVCNYKNDAATRAFFQQHCGAGFRFNEYLRGFAKGVPEGQDLTYGDLVQGWKEAEGERKEGKTAIGKQFEYNQFTRDFFAANAGGSREEMMEAWRAVRSYQGPNTYEEFKKLTAE